MDVQDLILDVREHKILKKYKSFLERRYGVKILVPKVVNLFSIADIIFGSIIGDRHKADEIKKFISKKVLRSMDNCENTEPNNAIVITLSDSEEEFPDSESEDSCDAKKLHPLNSEEKNASHSSLHDDSVCIIENACDSKRFLSNVTNPIQTSEPLEDSIYLIENKTESKICPKLHSSADQIVSLPSPDTSICIIDSATEKIPETEKAASKRVKSRWSCKKRKRKEFNKVSEPLPSASGAQDSGICEVSSTTEEPVLKRPRLCDESGNSVNQLPVKTDPCAPENNALFKGGNSGLKASNAEYRPALSVQTEDAEEDIIILDDALEAPEVHAPKPSPSLRRLRPVVIDGNNVARSHGTVTNTYSCKGIELCIDYFLKRGHTEVIAFVPNNRRHADRWKFYPTTDAEILERLAKAGRVVFTPSRRLNGQRYTAYDDRFVVELASKNGGVIVSNDNFKDLIDVNEEFKEAIEKRLLMYCFAGDIFMVPDDPLGRSGPTLSDYLCFPVEDEPKPETKSTKTS